MRSIAATSTNCAENWATCCSSACSTAQIAAEAGRFDIADVVQAITDKLIRRHPHVFTPAGRPLPASRAKAPNRADASGRARAMGEAQGARAVGCRQAEARAVGPAAGRCRRSSRAHEIGTRVGGGRIRLAAAADVIAKIDEEVRELRGRAQRRPGSRSRGDGRPAVLDRQPRAQAWHRTRVGAAAANEKFTPALRRRAKSILESRGRNVHDATLDELEAAWNRVKTASSTPAPPTRARSSIRTCATRPSVSTLIAPSRSVLKTLAPIRSKRATTSGAGCPNRLPRPALTRATCGAYARTKAADVDVRLP